MRQVRNSARRLLLLIAIVVGVVGSAAAMQITPADDEPDLGREVAVLAHLQDGEEFTLPLDVLLAKGRELFVANWTRQEGAGRPLSKGTGAPLADDAAPLVFPRNFNRISAPDANSCAGCHNAPFGIAGGGGDFVTSVFVLSQRFDFVTFDRGDMVHTRGTKDEAGSEVTLQSVGNRRASLGMFGSGYIEMLARQMTAELQAIRDATAPGQTKLLMTKGITFGTISRREDGTWDVTHVEGLPAPSLITTGPTDPPSLIIRPFHQAGAVISLRHFTSNAFIQHHGIQPNERFGADDDRDGDGFVNELTRADMTAVTLFQATMAVPGRVIPRHPTVEAAVRNGERLFDDIGCTACHVPALPLEQQGETPGWVFTEPNPYNPPGNLQVGDAPTLAVDLTDPTLPPPRLAVEDGIVWVPAFTDLKLHDITGGPDDPNGEPIDMNATAGDPTFFAGNRRFLTRKLWGVANEPPYFHHGQFTTMREAVLAHAGEALPARRAFVALSEYDRNSIIEFLKTLQVLPPGTQSRVVDEEGMRRQWPP